jgi:hypothetical protein
MKTPQAKKAVVIVKANPKKGVIAFQADEEVVELIRQAGMGSVRLDADSGNQILRVSERFSFNEVHDWLKEQAA